MCCAYLNIIGILNGVLVYDLVSENLYPDI
jgi:hypothetical protein